MPLDVSLKNHFAYTPFTPCDSFDLRVRFDLKHMPERIWRVSEAFHRELDERLVDGEPLTADRSGEVQLHFDDLLAGLRLRRPVELSGGPAAPARPIPVSR